MHRSDFPCKVYQSRSWHGSLCRTSQLLKTRDQSIQRTAKKDERCDNILQLCSRVPKLMTQKPPPPGCATFWIRPWSLLYFTTLCQSLFLFFTSLGAIILLPDSLITTQQNFNSICHLLDTVTTWWLDSDSLVTVGKCLQHSDYTATGTSVTMLPAINNSDHTLSDHFVVTVP